LSKPKIITSIKYLISSLIILSSVFIFVQVSLPLFDVNKNDVDKKKVIGMIPSVPLEFDNGEIFWWLVRNENILEFHNSSDEKIKGNIVLNLQSNPCDYSEELEMKSENKVIKAVVSAGKTTNVVIPMEITYRSSSVISVNFTNEESCFVINGDKRNFGAKLISWNFE
jgi:hypothetical protein